MRFLSLEIDAFGPYARPVKLPLARQGLVLVEGANGAGKSMLFEALLWALFGKMTRYGDRRLGQEEVCNRQRDLADVTLVFEVEDRRYQMRRVRKGKTAPTLSVKIWGESDTGAWRWFPAPGVAIHAGDVDTVALVGYDYETARTGLFLQGTGLTLATAGFQGQMLALESALSFQTIAQAHDAAKKKQSALSTEETIARADLVRHAEVANLAERMITQLEELGETAEETTLIQAIDLAERGIADEQAAIALAVPEAEVERLWAAHMEAMNVFNLARSRASRLTEVARQSTCPMCEGPLDPETVVILAEAATDHAEQAGARCVQAKEAYEALSLQATRAREARARANQWEVHRGHHLQALDHLNARKRERMDLIAQQQRLLDEAQVGEAEATEKLRSLGHDLSSVTFWSKAFGPDGLRAHVLKSAIPILNHAATRYTSILFDDPEVRVEFNPVRESKAENLVKLQGFRSQEFLGCSMGERRRIAIVLALSFRAVARWRMARTVNLGLWDEVFEGLDEHGMNRAMAILQQEVDEAESVFLITHTPAMRAMFSGAKVLRVTAGAEGASVQWE